MSSGIEGIGDCITSLNDIGNNIMGEIDKILARSATEMDDIAKEDVPEDTGVLASSIKMTKKISSESFILYEIDCDAEYAISVEYGTENMEAQPFLRPALDKVRGDLKLEIKFLT
jgi:HK97 gp10 family phage protein